MKSSEDAQHQGEEVTSGRTTFECHMQDVKLKAGEPEAEENCGSPPSPSIRSLDLTKDTLIFELLFYLLKGKLPVGVGRAPVEEMELGGI